MALRLDQPGRGEGAEGFTFAWARPETKTSPAPQTPTGRKRSLELIITLL